MVLGRQRERQGEILVTWAELPRSPGHVFYDRLQAELIAAGFDCFVERLSASYYASRRDRPSLLPDRYFRMLLVVPMNIGPFVLTNSGPPSGG